MTIRLDAVEDSRDVFERFAVGFDTSIERGVPTLIVGPDAGPKS